MHTLTRWLIILSLFLPNIVNALEVATHRAINKMVGNVQTPSGFTLNKYLINNLGFSKGIEEEILDSSSKKNQQVYFWLSDGGYYEDIPKWYLPYIRSLNHFHNPITEEGFKGDCLGSSLCVSSTVWALMPLGTQSSTTGNYSWLDVRGYYYKALTSSTKTERDTNFAETFRGLGQLMHLVQDASVPEHARNDFHLYGGYEGWVADPKNVNISAVTPTFFGGAISNIASFIDTNQYNGNNPGDTANNTVGLSEYSNANFLSEDTIFSSFPYPNKSSTDLQDYINGNKLPETVTGEDNIPDITFYIKKERDGEVIERFVKPGYFTNPLLEMGANEPVFSLSFILDDNVYSNYASLLLPRAVGYSAGLLNYFFRGNMDFTIDANDREDGVKGVKISNSSTEDMNGTFSLYYDTADTNRHFLGSWNISLASQEASQVLSFPLPQDNIPRYTLVFRGKMGTEKDAVAGSRAGWREEWNNGLHGNHTWLYSGIDTVFHEDDSGVIMDLFWGNESIVGRSVNEVTGGKLIKENIRYAGEYSKSFLINETLLRNAYTTSLSLTRPWPYCFDEQLDQCYTYDFGEEIPMPITKDSWISVKIDEISINEAIPDQNCSGYSGTGSKQGIKIKFDNGYSLSFTIPGQELESTLGKDWLSYIEPGEEWSYNIFATFQNAGIEFIEPVNITSISIYQKLNFLCERTTVEHLQRMVVDYIRIQDK